MVELSTPIKSWKFHGIRLQSKGCRFNSCPFHFLYFELVIECWLNEEDSGVKCFCYPAYCLLSTVPFQFVFFGLILSSPLKNRTCRQWQYSRDIARRTNANWCHCSCTKSLDDEHNIYMSTRVLIAMPCDIIIFYVNYFYFTRIFWHLFILHLNHSRIQALDNFVWFLPSIHNIV